MKSSQELWSSSLNLDAVFTLFVRPSATVSAFALLIGTTEIDHAQAGHHGLGAGGACCLRIIVALFTVGPAKAVERVAFQGYGPGEIVVKSNERKLYLVLPGGEALRYPVAVGKPGKQWFGVKEIDGKYIRPAWSPPEEVKRDVPSLPDVIEGGSPIIRWASGR